MSILFRRTIPLAITSIIAITMILPYFIDFGATGSAYQETILSFAIVIITAAMGLGITNFVLLHLRRIESKTEGKWIFSLISLLSMILMLGIRIAAKPGTPAYDVLFDYTFSPLQSTVGQLFIVWLAAPFTRAIKIRSGRPDLGGLLLISAFALVIFANTPISGLWSGFQPIGSWLVTVNNRAIQRGITITVGIGIIAIATRIIIGKEKTYLREEMQ
jgi:uncharacterized membrane protein YczE